MSNNSPVASQRLILAGIMGALILWGAYIAIGAYLYNHDPWRGAIVVGCVSFFVGFWLLMLSIKRRAKKP
jgi:hypothetical protein